MEIGSTKDTKRHEVNHRDLDPDRDLDQKFDYLEKGIEHGQTGWTRMGDAPMGANEE